MLVVKSRNASFVLDATLMNRRLLFDRCSLPGSIAETAKAEAATFIEETYGKEFSSHAQRKIKNAQGAQDAHEAVRPTSVLRTPEEIKQYLDKDQLKLYTLIWSRFVASQMTPAILDTMKVTLEQNGVLFIANGSKVKLRGEEPLVVVDGVPTNQAFSDFNQDVIENITVLKGATASALYGSRGGNGAIMITTKKGGDKGFSIEVNTSNMFNAGQLKIPEVQTAYSAGSGGKLIANNEVRFDKKIRAWKESGETLHVQEVKDPVEEASYVVEQIKKQMETGILAEEIAVLFRVHTDARAVVEALIDEKIPFQMREHLPNLYNHFIAKDIMAYFRLAMGQRERKDFLQVMNRPKRYLGRDCLPGRVVSFEEMRKFYCDKEWMQDRIDQFEWDLKMLAKMAPYAAIQYLKKKIGYDEFLREYATTKNMKAADLREVLSEIEEAAKPFQTMEEWFVHVEEYTEALKKKEQQKEQNQEGVRLMTLHASKGLEFHTVFLIEANEGRIPYQKAEKEQNVEEERRLFYVGMTRAKDVLKITYVKIKNGKEISPSRFVEELFEGV